MCGGNGVGMLSKSKCCAKLILLALNSVVLNLGAVVRYYLF